MRIHNFGPFSLLALALVPSQVFGDTCDSVRQLALNKDFVQSQTIDSPGRYCLRENLEVKGIFSFGHSPRTSSSIIGISAAEVILDFNSHSASSDANLEAGIDTTVSYQPKRRIDNPPKEIVIRNGSIRLTRRGAGVSIVGLGGIANGAPISISSDLGWVENELFHARERAPESGKSAKTLTETTKLEISAAENIRLEMPKLSEYPNRKILIENMKIRTRRLGIVIQGADTVIRDSVIEVDSGTAIWLYGPNSVIENNTIIVHGEAEPKVGLFLLEADAPIRLHHGDGALVRNNRIIIAGKANRRAISLFDTGPIRVENNTVYGLSKTNEMVKAFLGNVQLSEFGNKFEPTWKSWFSTWPPRW